MTLGEWIELGVASGFVLPTACATHDGIPFLDDDEEEAIVFRGEDECQFVLRIIVD